MMNIFEYYDLDFLESLIAEDTSISVLDGRWERPLAKNQSNRYFFNVPGDTCGIDDPETLRKNPCYEVNISNIDGKISVAFKNKLTMYKDVDVPTVDGRNVGDATIKGVLKAVGEYITTVNPSSISWTPVGKYKINKKTGEVTNPEARKVVYEYWALKNLFPDKYVGMGNNWIRRDVYDKEYVTTGYPEVPENLHIDSGPGTKRKAYEELQEKIRNNASEISQNETKREQLAQKRIQQERKIAEEENRRRKEEALKQALNDESKNPAKIQKGDIVLLNIGEDNPGWQTISNLNSSAEMRIRGRIRNNSNLLNTIGEVDSFRFGSYYGDDDDLLYAYVKFARDPEDQAHHGFSGQHDYVPIMLLKKESEENKTNRLQKKDEIVNRLLSDRYQNPNNIQKNDDVIYYDEYKDDDSKNGLIGKIQDFKPSSAGNYINAKIAWNEEALQKLSGQEDFNVDAYYTLYKLNKATPEKVQEIRRKLRQKDIEKRVTAGQERWTTRSQQATPSSVDAAQEDYTNHPDNPLHLKPGDPVVLNPNYYRGRRRSNYRAILVRIEKRWYGDRLEAYIRFIGSSAEPYRVGFLEALSRDDSPETQQYLAQQQRRQERAQRASSGTGGHNIGDEVTVLTGRHRGKTGRIVSFRMAGTNMNALIAPLDGEDFTVNVNMLQPPVSTMVPNENCCFKDYLRYVESRINR